MPFPADDVTGERIVLVTVDAPHQDRLAVDEQLPLADLHLPEPDARRDHAQHPVGAVLEGEEQGVEVGLLVRPLRRDPRRGLRATRWSRPPGATRPRVMSVNAAARPSAIEQRGLQGERTCSSRDAFPTSTLTPSRASLVVGVEIRHHREVPDVERLDRPQGHVAVDPGEAPEVLALEVRAVRVPVHLHREQVLPGSDELGDVELGRGPALLAVADLPPVDPEIEGRGDAFEGDHHPAAPPELGHLEAVTVRADRVLVVGDAGGCAPAPGVADVHVDRHPVALDLHVRGHGYLDPARVVESRLMEVQRPRVGVGRPLELPPPVEPPVPGRFPRVQRSRLRGARIGNDEGVRGLLVDPHDPRVLPVVVRPRRGLVRGAAPARTKKRKKK